MDRIDFPSVSRAPAPVHVPDQRATADTAALTRNPRPDVPLPVAPIPLQGISQTGAVARSLLIEEPTSTTDPTLPIDKRLTEAPRILKPYGLSMLPDPRREARIEEANRREVAARRAADEAKARESDATAERRTADAAATQARSDSVAEARPAGPPAPERAESGAPAEAVPAPRDRAETAA